MVIGSAASKPQSLTPMDKNANLLFEYLKNIIYEPDKAHLDLADLDQDFEKLGQGLQYFAELLAEERAFIDHLARGELDVEAPRKNELLAPLKSLQASLRHLTFQSQQVAKGDYTQRVDFMGEFSAAFNEMIKQLESRQKSLESEMEKTRQNAVALQDSIELLGSITRGMPEGILVVAEDRDEVFFSNPKGEFLLQQKPGLIQDLAANQGNGKGDPQELTVENEGSLWYYSIRAFPVMWKEDPAQAYIISDISAVKRRQLEMEHLVSQDALTGVGTRYMGMRTLRSYLEQQRLFVLIFVDIDNLKYVNDELGHKEGDRYIVTVARILASYSDTAQISRIGGDEFMIIDQNTTEIEAEKKMDGLRNEVMASRMLDGKGFCPSISYGVAPNKNQLTASDLLALADERMYHYKKIHKDKLRQLNRN